MVCTVKVICNVMVSSKETVCIQGVACLQPRSGCAVCRYMQRVGVAEQMPMQDGSMLQSTNMQRV